MSSLKKTSFIKQLNKDNRKYEIAKSIAYLQTKVLFGEKRKQKELIYSIFEHDGFYNRNDNGLPEQYYFKPTDIIIYDLLRKEDLPKAKKGLIRLYKKCYSHKYIGSSKSEEDIERIIQGLDKTIHSGNSWYKTSHFDFTYDNELEAYIHSFEINFRNLSSSYVAIEMRIELAEVFVNELSHFINESYEKPGMCIHQMWGRSKKKSGAKITLGVSSGIPSEYAKNRIVYEQFRYVKQIYMREIVKYFPLVQYVKDRAIGSINIFETNVTPSKQLNKSVYAGLGLDEMEGFYFSPGERLYISEPTFMARFSDEHDMKFVYNPELIVDYEMYLTAHNKVLDQLTMNYMDDLYRVVILRGLGNFYSNLISDYRNKINRCKGSRRQYNSLLKLQYQINQDFYDFKKIDEELSVDVTFKNASTTLNNNEYAKASTYCGIHTCDIFIDTPKRVWKQIKLNYTEVKSDLERKLEISDSLLKYTSEKKHGWMASFQMLLAATTFFFLIFPSKAATMANWIMQLWNCIKSLI